VIDTRPAITPFSVIEKSGFLKIAQLRNSAAKAPPTAARLVLRMTVAIAWASARAAEHELRAAVEAEPADPQQEDADARQRQVVAGHRDDARPT
jgi:fermentation-respiration switch protein FrsA (DUF1100 family)